MANRYDRDEQWNRDEWQRDEREQQDWGIRRYPERGQRGRSADEQRGVAGDARGVSDRYGQSANRARDYGSRDRDRYEQGSGYEGERDRSFGEPGYGRGYSGSQYGGQSGHGGRREGEQGGYRGGGYREFGGRHESEYGAYGGGGYSGYAGRREGGYGQQRGAWSQRVFDADARDDDRTGAAYRAVGGSGIGYGNASQSSPHDSRRSGYSGRGPKDYKRSDDRIREDVCDRLSMDDDVDASDISITVQNGEVTLEGTVETRRMKHRAEDIAEAVSGVKDVNNGVRVRKGLLNEIADRVTGNEADQHHANSGTRTTGKSGTSAQTSTTESR